MNILKTIILVFNCLLFTDTAYAMHISEGILPFNWALFWSIIAAPFVGWGLYKLKKLSEIDISFKPLVGLMAAIVFVISCMPVPVPTAGTCSHPCGTGISGILVGPAISILITAVALLLQALFLAHGGLSTWGADIVSMGVMGSFAGYLTFRGLRALKTNLWIAGFMAGLLADWATYFTTSVELASGIRGDSPFLPLFWKIFVAFIPTQLPLGILEGAMTAGMVMLLYKKRPDLLIKMQVIKPQQIVALGITFLLLILPASYTFASEKWGGVDESVVEKYAEEYGRMAQEPIINTDQGDLLLFVFLLAGTIGGFAAGYSWRRLIEQKEP
jgi:cobalt/nickel transport system permease protein